MSVFPNLPSHICTFASVTMDLTAKRPQPNSQKNTTLLSTEALSSQNLSVSGSKFEYCVLGKLAEHNPAKPVRGTKTFSKKKRKKDFLQMKYLRRPQVVGQKTLCSRAAEQKVSVCAQLSPGGTEKPAVV